MDQQLDIQLKNLQTKLQSLLKQNQLLQKQAAGLQKENTSLKIALEERDDSIARLRQQVDVSQLNTAGLSDKEKLELRKRIDVYLAEIDKCLALINE
ncbi:hypothetical protein I5907_10060 [Panacibacter sp. DH6]|uniref:Uncharacterized protein n=1 Tax=Panacibacter microcysteis TaxID=2793269 RepID=A0A931E7G9_9BACT|nr:hypothetical protein [Panacibacter microcysteis]MBG9376579.1 hypothetical protein [Panacibacter microcysteis]